MSYHHHHHIEIDELFILFSFTLNLINFFTLSNAVYRIICNTNKKLC